MIHPVERQRVQQALITLLIAVRSSSWYVKEAFENMDLVPLKLPSTMCLFCLGDGDLSSHARTASFSPVNNPQRHIDDLYLSHYDQDVTLFAHTTHATPGSKASITSRTMLLLSIMYLRRKGKTYIRYPTGSERGMCGGI